MTSFARLAAAVALVGGVTAPAAAQYNPYPTPQYQYPAYPGQQYPQQYPPQYPQQYPPQQTYPGYGYNQGYGQNPVADIIDQLLGNRYNVTDRQAVRQCARAATVQARNQYGGYGQTYGQGYGYQNQAIAAPAMRVSAITDVQRRSNGLRVRGLISAGTYGGYGGYNQGYGYQNQGYGDPRYAQAGDLTFRCTVDYRGAVTSVRVYPNSGYRRY